MGEQGVQRVDPEHVRAERGTTLDQHAQVCKVADAPVMHRAQRIQLHGQSPHACALGKDRRLIACLRSDDEAGLSRGFAGRVNDEAVVAAARVVRQG